MLTLHPRRIRKDKRFTQPLGLLQFHHSPQGASAGLRTFLTVRDFTSPLAGASVARWAMSGSTATSGPQSPMAVATPGARTSASMATPARPAAAYGTTVTPSVV